jgi:hypothetical protein
MAGLLFKFFDDGTMEPITKIFNRGQLITKNDR